VWVVSFDFVDETMQYVQEGVIYATIGQDPSLKATTRPSACTTSWLLRCCRSAAR